MPSFLPAFFSLFWRVASVLADLVAMVQHAKKNPNKLAPRTQEVDPEVGFRCKIRFNRSKGHLGKGRKLFNQYIFQHV